MLKGVSQYMFGHKYKDQLDIMIAKKQVNDMHYGFAVYLEEDCTYHNASVHKNLERCESLRWLRA